MDFPKVVIHEECMREGMQIESAEISIDDKVRLLDALSRTGLTSINVGSFVSPRYTPQMARMEELLERFSPVEGVRYYYLAFNRQGHERAARFVPPLSAPGGEFALICHLCDTFARRNMNMSQAQEIERWPTIVDAARAAGATEAAIGVGAAWGSNFTGLATLEDRLEMLRRAHGLWDDAGVAVTKVVFADPMSWCMPHRVEETLEAVQAEWPAISTYHLHLHDARGMALPSIYAALRALDPSRTVSLDLTAGGIGGCPYCGNGRATGMAATEDVVVMLEEMGMPTGVDVDRLIDFVWMLEDVLGRLTPGHVSKAGPLPRGDALYDPNLPFIETHEEARHFRLGPEVAAHQVYPWKEPIPAPDLHAPAS
ncbi:MAG: citramalate synthase [Acidimicrobiia bacterium]